jgi:glycosyltransferase involved in cell wall biosynthesis
VHNVPDWLVFSVWLPKLRGAKILLDIHDILPEFYASKFHTAPDSIGVRLQRLSEWFSARFADHVILASHLWLDKYRQRSAKSTPCSVFINNVDSRAFFRRERRPTNRPIVMFPGGLQWHQGVDIAIRAFLRVSHEMPGAEFHIYGDGSAKSDLFALTRELGLSDKIRFFDPVPAWQIADVMAQADVGVVPKRADSFGNEAYSTKIMEFMALGVPVVVSSTKIDRFYFNDSVVKFFESGNSDALADALLLVLKDRELRSRMVANALEYVTQNSWETRKADYLSLIDLLVSHKS